MDDYKKDKYRVEQRTVRPDGTPMKPFGALGRMVEWFHLDSDNNLSYDKAVERIQRLSTVQRWNKILGGETGRSPWQYRIVNVKTNESLSHGDVGYCYECGKWVQFSVRNNIAFGVVYVCKGCSARYKCSDGSLEKLR